MENRKDNTVAAIIKGYSILNGLIGSCMGFAMELPFGGDLGKSIKIFFVSAVIVVSFLLYCIGETIQLLEDIKSSNVAVNNKVSKVMDIISKNGSSPASAEKEDISSILPEI